MKKYMLLLLLTPMMSFGMQDPRDSKSELDDNMFKQFKTLFEERVKANGEALLTGTVGIGVAIKASIAKTLAIKAAASTTAAKLALVKAMCAKGALTSTTVTPTMVTGAYSSLTGFPLLSTTIAVGSTIGFVGAAYLAKEGYGLIGDLKKISHDRELYFTWKKKQIEEYDKKVKEIALFNESTEGITWF